jgi:predicted alpha/beta-hydrolase family hydrolase
MPQTIRIETPKGEAEAERHEVAGARAALVLGHGAGGGVGAPDLQVARDVALAEGVSVALVTQPYRVAGKSSQPAASTIDTAWVAAVEHLAAEALEGMALVVGGRSAGARVACRTAAAAGAAAVLCLAFPLEPPQRKDGTRGPSRLPELDGVSVPTLVVQGESDRFGMPPDGPNREVVAVAGDHGLKKDLAAVAEAIRGWLPGVVAAARA